MGSSSSSELVNPPLLLMCSSLLYKRLPVMGESMGTSASMEILGSLEPDDFSGVDGPAELPWLLGMALVPLLEEPAAANEFITAWRSCSSTIAASSTVSGASTDRRCARKLSTASFSRSQG